ncbi:glycosyltransferase [Arthrobacter sp. Z1-9]
MPKTVAVIGTRGYPSYYGGFETAVRKLAPFLVDAGWSVRVYGRAGSTKPHDPELDIRVQSINTLGLDNKSLSTLSFGLTSVIHAMLHRPDVALVMNVANGFWLPLLRLRGIPSIVNVDGIEWERAKWGRLAKLAFKLGAKFTARFGTVLVSDSEEIRRRWQSEFGRDSVFIPYGGEFPDELPVVEGLETEGYALMVARFVPENTVQEFFTACEEIAEEYPVVIVGSSGYGGELEKAAAELASKHENVTWLGHVSDDKKLMSLWQHAGAYFHGHSVGGTNPALVQAMACGAPVVARRTPYNLEVLGRDEHLVAAEPEAIVGGLRRMLSNKGKRDAARVYNRDRAWTHYNWAGVCEAYEHAIAQTISVSRGDIPANSLIGAMQNLSAGNVKETKASQ